MPSCSTLQPVDSRFFGLFIGPSGAGKTPAACSFITEAAIAAGRRVKVLDFDGRIQGILGCPWVNRDAVDYDYIPPRIQGGVLNRINNELKTAEAMIGMGTYPYDTLIIDSLTWQTFAFLCDAISLTHSDGKGATGDKKKGQTMGGLQVEGPSDYKYESSGTYSLLSWVRSLPIKNIIFTATVIDRYGKEEGADGKVDPYAPSVIVGEKISLRDKLAANIPGLFNHVFRFERKMSGNTPKFYVRFWSDLARTVYPNMPLGDQDVTGKNFYHYLNGLLKESNNGTTS